MLRGILKPRAVYNWKTFDEIFPTDQEVCGKKFLKNFVYNSEIGLGKENSEVYRGDELIIYQHGGNFDKLLFCDVKMSGVCCEIIATYNFLVLSGKKVDFFRLASEFEYNAVLKPPVIRLFTRNGTWGSNPYAVRACFDRYGISYDMYDSFENKNAFSEFKKSLVLAKYAFVSYAWKWDRISIKGRKFGAGVIKGIHTFVVVCEKEGKFRTFNRYSNHQSSVEYGSFDEILGDGDSEFLVGYIIK